MYNNQKFTISFFAIPPIKKLLPLSKLTAYTLKLLLITLLFTTSVTANTTSSNSAKPQTPSTHSASHNIYGLWLENKKKKVAVMITDCDKQLCGHIYWLKKPLTREGKIKRDPQNPDETLRERFLCGMKILSGFSPTEENNWDGGEIYNPSDGYTFSSTIKRAQDGSLKIRGYIGIPLFGKTTKWQRPQKELPQCNN